MGVFGVAEIVRNLELREKREVFTSNVQGLFPKWRDLASAWKAIVRGTALGSLLGILPGGTAVLASFAAYTLEKRVAKDPSRFGQGAIEGVAAPEAANNAAAQTSFIPMLTLGIPSNPVMALMIGAMTIHGIQPGPQVLEHGGGLFWGMTASMWLGNLMLLLLNLPLVGLWVYVLKVPYRLLYPAILFFCCIGVYSLNNNIADVLLLALFSLIGYVLLKLDCEPAPLLLAFVLGPMMEEELRRAVNTARGDFSVFLRQPLSAALLAVATILLLIVVLPTIRKKREEAFQE
jgi:putative tricarboxylic transport membrane protein